MDNNKIIGRIEVYEKIRSRLEDSSHKFLITSIGGSGGIGKTYLLDKLLEDISFDDNGYLVIFPETNKKDSFEKYITEGLVSSVNAVLPITKGYFNETSKFIKELTEAEAKRKKELLRLAKQSKILNKIDEDIIDNILDLIIPMGNRILEFAKLSHILGKKGLKQEEVEAFAKLIKNLRKKGVRNPLDGRIPDLFGKRTLKHNILNNFNESACNAMVNDISYILKDAEGLKEKFKLKGGRGKEAKKLKNLVLVIDDYEFYQEKLNNYFISYFIPAIRRKPFKTHIILVGRDLILDTSAEWDKFAKNIEQFEITTFDKDSCIEYLNNVNIFDETAIDRLINDTEGYPYMLYLEATAYKDGGDIGAHKKKLFYDRITKWMDDNEKEWFESLCFLDVINADTVSKMLPNDDASHVFKWFTNQASIRDSKSTQYRVKPFLKSKTIDYLQNISPENYNELRELANRINFPDSNIKQL